MLTQLHLGGSILSRMEQKFRFLWLPTVIGRLCIFFFFVTLVVALLFLLGNFQDFLDSTQVLLLHLFDVSCTILVVSCLYYAGVLGWLALRRRLALHLGRFILALATVLVFGSLYVGARYLLVWL